MHATGGMNATVCPGPFVDPPTCEMTSAQLYSPWYEIATVVVLLSGMFIFVGASTHIVLTLMTNAGNKLKWTTIQHAVLIASMGACQVVEAGNYHDMRCGLYRLTNTTRWTSMGLMMHLLAR